MIKIVTENGTLIEGPWKDDEGRYQDGVRLTNPKGERSELSWHLLSRREGTHATVIFCFSVQPNKKGVRFMIKKLRAGAFAAILSTTLIGQFTVGNLATLTAITSIPVITGAASCSKDQLVASGQDVLDVVTDKAVLAALAAVSAEAVAKLRSMEPTARNLVAAIKAGDFTNAIGLVNTLFPFVNQIADLLRANQRVLGIVALANVALHFIINHVQGNSPQRGAVASDEMVQAANYGSQPAWGCGYHKTDKRCK